MDRKKKISLKGQIILSERYECSLKQIQKRYEKERLRLNEDYLNMWRSLFKRTKIQQITEKKGKVQYLVISLLHSSIFAKSYDFRFDVYDKELYLDSIESCSYWSPNLFFTSIEGDMAFFTSAIKRNMIQVTNAELEEFEMEYAYRFMGMALSYFCETCEQVFRLKEYEDISKEKKVFVLFGTYVGKTQTIADHGENTV